LNRWGRGEQIQSTRDQNFNAAKQNLSDWIADHLDACSQWLMEATANIQEWRSPARLVNLILSWQDHRFNGDQKIFGIMEAWRKHELHLHRFQTGVLREAQEWREHLYRNIAVELSKRYKTAHV